MINLNLGKIIKLVGEGSNLIPPTTSSSSSSADENGEFQTRLTNPYNFRIPLRAYATLNNLPDFTSSDEDLREFAAYHGTFRSRQSTQMRRQGPLVSYKLFGFYVRETLRRMRTMSPQFVKNKTNFLFEPGIMGRLFFTTETEFGWSLLVKALVDCVPLSDPVGASVISTMVALCPFLLTVDVNKVAEFIAFDDSRKYHRAQHRNALIVLGCVAQKFSGAALPIMENIIDGVISHLHGENDSTLILFALVCIEKLGETEENRDMIMTRIDVEFEGGNPLQSLENRVNSDSLVDKQVGFCAAWLLDNIFVPGGRTFSYELVDNAGTNIILNSKDLCTGTMKISADGFQVRCDAISGESVRTTHYVDSGQWYYEVTVLTPGIMQIGWASRASKFLNHLGSDCGIGDDEFSVGYDGCRQFLWHDGQARPTQHISPWKPGDVLGFFIDVEECDVIFFHNGQYVATHTDIFAHAKDGFMPAATLMSFQQCIFNFGKSPFVHKPGSMNFQPLNECVTPRWNELMLVLPKHLRGEECEGNRLDFDNPCYVCSDEEADTQLLPCGHQEFCSNCVQKIRRCPLCRELIMNKVTALVVGEYRYQH